MSKKIIYLSSIFLLFFSLNFALAHGMHEIEEMMGKSMMSKEFQEFQSFEDEVLGSERHEQMEKIMEKIMKGESLTPEEKEEFFSAIKDNQTMPGMMTMMMRHIMEKKINNQELPLETSFGIMKGPMGSLIGILLVLGVFVNLAFLVLAILGILALTKWLKKN